MAKQRAIVKSLPAVETLGSVSVICSDKTGTLTQNLMTVKAICTAQALYRLHDAGTVERVVKHEEKGGEIEEEKHLLSFLIPGILCNDSTVFLDGEEKKEGDAECSAAGGDVEAKQGGASFVVQGDPTETCLVTVSAKLIDNPRHIKEMQSKYTRLAEVPFDSAQKYMASLHSLPPSLLLPSLSAEQQQQQTTQPFILVKGAPEKVLKLTSLSEKEIEGWKGRAEALAGEGMRVLALAYQPARAGYSPATRSLAEEITMYGFSFSLLSLVGILDPPRPEAIVAVRSAQQAGIEVKMITGDHPRTALAIAQQLGLKKVERAITGQEIDEDLDKLEEMVRDCDVFARTTPEHKLRIVQALQRQGLICSMTGDGVNDAPALKAANIGVAMGITGTEVAKDAANMVITDDNFATIVEAIKVGRNTYSNLIKTLAFVLPTNGGQAFSIIMALVIGVDVPITALQILWVNMATSITLGLVFAFEPAHDQLMELPPRHVDKGVFGKFLTWRVFFVSTLLVIAVLVNFQWEKDEISSIKQLRTASVNTLCAGQLGYVFNCRNLRNNVGVKGLLFGNRIIYAAILVAIILQVLFTYAPPLQYVFATEPLNAKSWGKIVLWAVFVFVVVELEKGVNSLRRCRQ